MFLVSSCSCLCPIHWSQVLSRERRCGWTAAAPTTSEWSTSLLPTEVHLILEVWRQQPFIVFLLQYARWYPFNIVIDWIPSRAECGCNSLKGISPWIVIYWCFVNQCCLLYIKIWCRHIIYALSVLMALFVENPLVTYNLSHQETSVNDAK